MTQASIMIVEDERITAEDLHDILTHLGYTVTALVTNGAEAIRQAGLTRPDLVLMDIHIKGDMDGIEAAREIREQFQIPVIYLTAHADRETLRRAKLAEPLGYLIKPFQETELLASIEMALHKQKADQAARRQSEVLSATLHSIGEAVIATDLQGRVVLMNAAAETWTGWPRADSTERPIEQVLQLKGHGSVGDFIQQAIRTGTLTELPAGSVVVTREGQQRSVGGTVSPIQDHHGQITGAAVVFGGKPEEVGGTPTGSGLDLVAESVEMQRLMHFARRVAASEVSTILLTGESGTGKDVIARFLHSRGRRVSQPFLAINCAAIPDTLLESELFGYEKGAFTDARAQKRGILEMASGGTVFLDEIGEMSTSLQAKLLRVLEEQKVRRLGGTADLQVDLRIITATNQDLPQAIQQGRFRLDLFYRLNVIQITVPPLRHHKQDILPLVDHFIGHYNRKFKQAIKGVSTEAAQALVAHHWPGNIRELRNAVERAMVLEDTPWLSAPSLGIGVEIQSPTHTPEPQRAAEAVGMSLEAAERTMLLNALQTTGWNQTRAAQLLSITRDTLRYKMKKFNLRADASHAENGAR